jgi:hypothetical protein
MEMKDLYLNAVYNFSFINIYKRPDDGSQFQPKNAVSNKSIKVSVVCDLSDTYIHTQFCMRFMTMTGPVLQ